MLRDKISVPREALPGICNRLHQGDIQEAKKTLGVRCACYSRITGSEPLSLRISDARRRGDPAAAEEP